VLVEQHPVAAQFGLGGVIVALRTAATGSRGVVEVSGSRVVVAWKETRAAGPTVMISEWKDDGATFTAPRLRKRPECPTIHSSSQRPTP
jgi:hypothetical protein